MIFLPKPIADLILINIQVRKWYSFYNNFVYFASDAVHASHAKHIVGVQIENLDYMISVSDV
jgi:hypothetical protein